MQPHDHRSQRLRRVSPVWRHLAISVAVTAACAVIVLLQGCGGGDCPADDPRCVEQPANDTPAPKPPCADARRCI